MESGLFLGHSQIDSDHAKMFHLIDKLAVVATDGQGVKACISLIGELISFMQHYFAREEALMKLYRFPLLTEHSLEHDEFLGEVWFLQKRLQTDSTGLSGEALAWMRDWLSDHITRSDQALVAVVLADS